MSEKELIQKCLDNDVRAQRMLYDQFVGMSMGVCMRYSNSETDAEDILQTGFIKVFKNLDSFTGKGPLGGWIRRIMVNSALQFHRDNKKHQMHVEIDEYEVQVESSDDVIAALSADDLRKKIQQLSDGYRLVFNLYAIEGYKHQEIAKELNIAVGTSKSQYNRARKLLIKMIEKEEAISGTAI